MTPAQVTSETVVALSMGELLTVATVLVSVIGGIIAFVRKDEKDNFRLNQNEKAIADLTQQVGKLTEQIQLLMQFITPDQLSKLRRS
jgi:hypothetical protein